MLGLLGGGLWPELLDGPLLDAERASSVGEGQTVLLANSPVAVVRGLSLWERRLLGWHLGGDHGCPLGVIHELSDRGARDAFLASALAVRLGLRCWEPGAGVSGAGASAGAAFGLRDLEPRSKT